MKSRPMSAPKPGWLPTQKLSRNAQTAVIGGVRVPYLSLEDLIGSQQTYREQYWVTLSGKALVALSCGPLTD